MKEKKDFLPSPYVMERNALVFIIIYGLFFSSRRWDLRQNFVVLQRALASGSSLVCNPQCPIIAFLLHRRSGWILFLHPSILSCDVKTPAKRLGFRAGPIIHNGAYEKTIAFWHGVVGRLFFSIKGGRSRYMFSLCAFEQPRAVQRTISRVRVYIADETCV